MTDRSTKCVKGEANQSFSLQKRKKKLCRFFFSTMATNHREENSTGAFDDDDGSPVGLGNLLGSYRSDSGEVDAGRDEAEAPESAREGDIGAAATTAAATTAATAVATDAAPPPPPQTDAAEPPAPQPAAAELPPPQPAGAAPPPPPPPLPPPPPTEAAPPQPPSAQQQQHQRDPLWLPSPLARAPASGSPVDPQLSLKVRRMLEASAAGRSLSAELRRSRAYRNPYFLEKMVDHLGLDPRASRLRAPRGCGGGEGEEQGRGGRPSSSFSIAPEDTADALELEEAAARRAASSAVTGRVDFVKGGGEGGGGGRGRWN